VTEALADVRAAQVVPAPEGRDLSAAVPGANDTGAAYEITETERAKATNALINLLFTVVETPTREDRRRDERAARDGDSETRTSDAHDGETDDARNGDAHNSETSDAHDGETDDARDGDAHDDETNESQGFGVEGYAGPK
jgi:hypothetical protein